ncbi:MAG: DEAD/DEAH box helicase, partial [Planctomycetota bacterium]|nr:DEAD/DEAH box helicase [Planctomycetota bacterium]
MPSATRLQLTTPIESVPGVGSKRGAEFRRLGVPSVAHLIHYIPARHEFEAGETAARALQPGVLSSARGEVTATRVAGRVPRQRFEAVLMDASGRIDLVWFNGAYLRNRIHPGMHLRVQGKPRSHGPNMQIANPDWEIIEPDNTDERADRLRPIYPASEALTSKFIDKAVQAVLDDALPLIEDHLPESFRAERALPALSDAYRMIHRPADEAEVAAARRRLAYDELLLLQLGVHMKRAQRRKAQRAPSLRWSQAIDEHIRARLPFQLTDAQNRVVNELVADLAHETPANRLIQGDVGSGKTAVALYAMLLAVANRRQAALMAPTELLAEQHYATISAILDKTDVRLALLTGAVSPADRASIQTKLAAGEIDLIVGTHALLTENVRFNSLAVAVIDEQHRFGVHQRATLREKADEATLPHTIVMTATPIPRTLALTVFGDLDVSTIDALPPGRTPITTRLVGPEQREEVYHFLRTRLEQKD